MQIDDLTRVCQLDENAVRMFQLAAKKAIATHIEKVQKAYDDMAKAQEEKEGAAEGEVFFWPQHGGELQPVVVEQGQDRREEQ